MKFAWQTDSYFFIKEWSTSTALGLVTAMVTSCILAVLYEYIRQVLTSRGTRYRHRSEHTRKTVLFLISQATLFMTSAFISNLLMLVLMTYNVWLFITILVGAGCGFYLVKPLFPSQVVQPEPQNINTIFKPKANLNGNSKSASATADPSAPTSSYFPLLSNPETELDNQESGDSSSSITQHTSDYFSNQTIDAGSANNFIDNNDNDNMQINDSNSIYDDDIGTILNSSPFKTSQHFSDEIGD